ncbi:H-2 class I histocompatibility antigen, Q8 alpha chain-like isoform X2 [Anguilla anguilla]|uniref:H-2 class I histocompatibility antigen, Q8 alpha chain-like isoform X2 n=1 Tax=Anguilla anguilla TaxID=7936 RepID=UPI0015B19417|nr:H-2 class I histocompatibility antigen, Q8 alpha chain-like isoform X2 [Anguilla anguilla]
MRVLGLLCVVLHGICWANAASHSLKYIYTVVTGDTDSPEFSITGLVNDEQFVQYDSNIRRMIPQTEWREISVDKQYWDKQTQKALYAHQIFKNNIVIAMQQFRSTQGVHILEWIVGCQWNDETGETGGTEHYEYDGKYFLTDDMKTWNFIPPAQLLFISAVKGNPAELENDKQYQTQICIESLKTYVSYKSTLERTVPPEVSLLQKGSSSPVITCHLTGFHPRDIMVTWQRNGEDLDVDVELGETVRNEDGTFQTRSHLRVKPEDWKSQNYTCTVQHKSLKQDIVLPVREENIKRNTDIKTARSFNPDGNSPPKGVIIGCVVGALILALTLAVIGFVIWKKRRSARSFIPEGSSPPMYRAPSSLPSLSSVSSIRRQEAQGMTTTSLY